MLSVASYVLYYNILYLAALFLLFYGYQCLILHASLAQALAIVVFIWRDKTFPLWVILSWLTLLGNCLLYADLLKLHA